MQAAMMEPSRTPSIRWLKMRERMTADVTRVTSKYTLNFPNSLLQLREAYFTNPSALIMATWGFISRTTPMDCTRQPTSSKAMDIPSFEGCTPFVKSIFRSINAENMKEKGNWSRISIMSRLLLLFRINQNCPIINSILMMNVQVPKDRELFRLNT